MKITVSFTIVVLLTLSIHSLSFATEPSTQSPVQGQIQAPTQEQPDDVKVIETAEVVVETRKTEIPADRIDVPTATTDVEGKVPELPSSTYMR